MRVKLLVQENARLKGPGTSYVAHSVATTSHNQGWQIEALDKFDTVCVTSHTEVKATKTIARQAVSTALKNDSLRSVPFHNIANDWLKNTLVGDIVDSVTERKVDGIVFA